MSERLFVLESSFVIYRLAPWHSNLPKRYIKSPKLYFHDTGLAVWLSGCLAAWLPGCLE